MDADWGYEQSNGPHTWIQNFPIVAGTRQSPVNISSQESIYDANLAANPIEILYQSEANMMVTNSGHSIQANVFNNSVISGGPLSATYKLQQFHLHWGATDDVGSEHTIDGKSSSAELHLVHYNCEKYQTFKEAMAEADGLAVFGVMVMIGKEHADLKHITDIANEITQRGQTTQLAEPFDPIWLLPDDRSSYWTYLGSLTTPPLHESVTWIVFRKPIEISREQLDSLRSLRDSQEGGQSIGNNYRPPLPLGDRKIRCSFKEGGTTFLRGACYLVVGAVIVAAAAVVIGSIKHLTNS